MSRVAVLKGGRSLERQVSLASGARVQDALERLGHDVVGIDVGHDLVARLEAEAPDACFVALHGRDGEDGTVQELLELLGLPYTGSGPAACARCADKVRAKQAMQRAGIPTPDFLSFSQAAFKELGASAALPHAGGRLGFPLVVKPADQGSALGVRVAGDAGELPSALVAAFSYSGKVLLERRIAGRDLAVSVLEGHALPVVEAVPEGDDAYQARYEVGGTRFACPADLPEAVTVRAQELAAAAHELMGCSGVSRADLMLEDGTGELFVLEVNAIPGMTGTSLLPLAADAAGIGFEELVARMLAPALAARAGGG